MKRHWEIDELIEHFTFLPNELSQIGNKSGATRFGFAVLFKFFQYEVTPAKPTFTAIRHLLPLANCISGYCFIKLYIALAVIKSHFKGLSLPLIILIGNAGIMGSFLIFEYHCQQFQMVSENHPHNEKLIREM